MTPLRISIDAGHMPSGSTTRRLPITRSILGMEELLQQILRHARTVRCRRADVIDGRDFCGECCQPITAFSNSRFGPPASQWHRCNAPERDANFTDRFTPHPCEAHLGNGLRIPCTDLAVV